MDSNQSLLSFSPSTQTSAAAPLTWVICPGSAHDVYTSVVPHGTIITANSFTSLFLQHAELSGCERVQFEVHLLTGGLMQIGWCATASGLPFTMNEGVGDFPLSVAADGCRGMLWNLTGQHVPALQWQPGDILSCYADVSCGTFDFALNGQHCCTAALPSKGVLLRHGARWFTDRFSSDEMLVYFPALSLAGGEACVVNVGEAPFRYPRSAYVSIDAQHTFSIASLTGDSAVSSLGLPSSADATAASPPPPPTTSLPSSVSTAGSVRVGLGGSSLADLFAALDLRGPVPGEGSVGSLETLGRIIVSPSYRVADCVLTLVQWFEADVQGRWRAMCMVLYLWILRFYWDAGGAEEGPDGSATAYGSATASGTAIDAAAEGQAAGGEACNLVAAPLNEANRQRMEELIGAAMLFLPSAHFLIVPGVLLAIMQHRVGNTPGGQETAARISRDLVAIEAFRHAWVRETGTFCSTLLNLFAVRAASPSELHMLAERISACSGGGGNRAIVELLQATRSVGARQGRMWLLAGQCVERLVADEQCRGPLVTALLRLVGDPHLRRPSRASDPLYTPHYNDGLPYTIALYMQSTTVGLLVLSVVSSLGKTLRPIDQACPVASADTLWGLGWRDVALGLLPVTTFYLRGLSGFGFLPSDWPDVRVGGSFHHVRRTIMEEEAALWAAVLERRCTGAAQHATAAAAAREKEGDINAGCAGDEESSEDPKVADEEDFTEAAVEVEVEEGDGEDTSLQSITRRSRIRPSRTAGSPTGPNGGPVGHTGGDRSTQNSNNPCSHHTDSTTDGNVANRRPNSNSSNGENNSGERAREELAALEPGMSLWVKDSRYWLNRAVNAQTRRGPFTTLSVADETRDGAGADGSVGTEEALAERGRELLLVAVVALAVFVQPVLGPSPEFLETLSEAVAAYQCAREAETAAAATEANGSNADCNAPGTDSIPNLAPASASPSPAQGEAAERQPRTTTARPTDTMLRRIAVSILPVLAIVEPTGLQGLALFAGAVCKVVSYYWSRMALYERLHGRPETVPPEQRERLWAQEREEGKVCPPRAFMMLPLPVMECMLHIWLFLGVALRRGTAMAERYPGLLLAVFDARRRRAVAHSPTRAYLYRAMASLLGFGAENRRQVAHIALEQERRCLATTNHLGRSGGSDTANVPLVSSILQDGILDCLDVYRRDDNFNDSAALNVLFALAQQERCLLPPPRMLDESFWWCLPQLIAAEATTRTAAAPVAAASATCGATGADADVEAQKQSSRAPYEDAAGTADEIYFEIFRRAAASLDMSLYTSTVVGKCNRLLTQLSELVSVRSIEAMTAADAKVFCATYTLLRKSLYVLDFMVHALVLHEEWRGWARRKAFAVCATPNAAPGGLSETPTAAKAVRTLSATAEAGREESAEGVPVAVFLRNSRHEAVASAIMDVLVQSVVRIGFTGGRPPSAAASRITRETDGAAPPSDLWPHRFSATSVQSVVTTAPESTASLAFPSPTLPPLVQAQEPQRQQQATVWTPGVPTAASALSATSRSGAVLGTESVPSNVLLPAHYRDAAGDFVCVRAPCTVVGLLAPVFALLHRILTQYGCDNVAGNPFLAATTELNVLVTRSRHLLEHPAWWAAAPPNSHSQRGGEGSASEEDEYLPANGQAQLRELQQQLISLEAAMAREGTGSWSMRRSRHRRGTSTPARAVAAAAARDRVSPRVPYTSTNLLAVRDRSAIGAAAAAAVTPAVPFTPSSTFTSSPLRDRTATADPTVGCAGANPLAVAPPAARGSWSKGFLTSRRSASSSGQVTDDVAHCCRTEAAEGEMARTEDDDDEEDDEEESDRLCRIRQQRDVDVALLPCGHRCCHLCFSRSYGSLVADAPPPPSPPQLPLPAQDVGGELFSGSDQASGNSQNASMAASLSSNFPMLSCTPLLPPPHASNPDVPLCFFCKSAIERVSVIVHTKENSGN